MNNASFSEKELKQAAAAVRRSMLDSIPPPSQCTHEFSPAFQAKMERLISRERRRGSVRKAMKRVAMFFLAALAGVSVWLTVDAEARTAFSSWVQEVYENSIVYRFFGEPAAEELPAYRLSWVPEGYEVIDCYEGNEIFSVFYQNSDNLYDIFMFEYSFIQDSSYMEMLIDETSFTYKKVTVDGIQADFYQALNPGETNNLIWIDEDEGVVFEIDGFLDETVIMRIAESIILTNSTK